ncbi:methyl-CPG-binding domain 6 [Hibiscus trionum]|uniref:Methyl-CPG-binding domain 6 n=1 Tax=Hibiscus trionum TaxID=183268 RepID=A0A9W7LXR7_HIBTR|nr:methyl-CPG-binding domain 6 [Hibiscus trionum]
MSYPVQPSTTDLPYHPLLKPGAFIDANDQNQSPEPPESRNGSTPNGAKSETPAQGSDISSSSAEPKGKRRVVPPETWLPAGWLIEDRVRSSGATAGLVDKYYVDPSSGRKFRSKKEVLHYLETGMPPPKKKKGAETSGSEDVGTGNSGGNKKKKPDKKPKPLNFDFINVPRKVDWLLTNASEDRWTPFLGDDQVAKPTRQDWAAAFASLIASKNG